MNTIKGIFTTPMKIGVPMFPSNISISVFVRDHTCATKNISKLLSKLRYCHAFIGISKLCNYFFDFIKPKKQKI